MAEEASRPEGLLDSLRKLAGTLLGVVQTRLEIIGSELEEERTRLARIIVLAAVAAFFLGLAINLLVFFLVVLFWEANRLLAIGVVTGVLAAAGIAAVVLLRSEIIKRPKLLSTTLAELQKDRDRLRP
jgi:uncharacterized membrane protein YqjE